MGAALIIGLTSEPAAGVGAQTTTRLVDPQAARGSAAVMSTEARRLGTDLDLPLDSDEDVRPTPTGDLPVISGRTNVRMALIRRALVAPGELLHRPEYGGGLVLEVGQPSTLSRRLLLANQIRRDQLRDPRIEDSRVAVSAGTPSDHLRSGAITVELATRIRGDDAEQTFTVSLVE
jgi:hypothetical protein